MAIDDSPLSSKSDSRAEETQTSNESQAAQNEGVFYKKKRILFRGRRRNIVLQDINGPCPLIAICNVLILRGELNLDLGGDEVSQENLLSLLADIMFENNDEEYIDIELLTSLAAGIYVNPKFTSIQDFEFTPELTIFSSLDIPLYHGWIVNPEDLEIATAIGGRSYNALMTELAALETQSVKDQSSGECSVDFAASITATLRCSKTIPFDDSSAASTEHCRRRKSDIEEIIALAHALELSKREVSLLDIQRDSHEEVSVSGSSDVNQNSEHETESNAETHEHDQFSSTESGYETDNSSKMTVEHVTSSEAAVFVDKINLESTKNNDSIYEIPLKSETVTFVNPDLEGKFEDDDVSLPKSERSVSSCSPVYEGESLLGQSPSEGEETNGLTPEEGEVIKRFLKDNASQLTLHGLFTLEDDLKEGELCVLFRNNHFSTMLKRDDKLFTLVTDQGYLMEQDLVWERLNQINGDSVFITGNFKVFKSGNGKSHNWDKEDSISKRAKDVVIWGNNSEDKDEVDTDPEHESSWWDLLRQASAGDAGTDR